MLAIALALLPLIAPPQESGPAAVPPPKPFGAVPSTRQLKWHELELYGFLHFTTNTFTDKEWGYGDESPEIFAPTDFDADQIVGVARDAGMRGLILTCKHHDGFCLWPSEWTDHDVAASPWRDGSGDVVREISDACRRHGLGFGVYLSPWDRNHPEYGRPAYVEYYRAQLRELLTEYGPVFEVWWDGANGGDGYYGGARESRRIDRGSYYGWEQNIALVRELQANAMIFSDSGPDVRWSGNERGIAGDPCWATYTPAPRDGESSAGPGTTRYWEGTNGHRNGRTWMPAECDVSIRPGWFYHASQDDQVKTPEQLVELYYASIGRGGSFLLNLPPDRRGRIHDNDIASLRGFRRILDATFGEDLAAGAAVRASEVRGGDSAYAAESVLDGDTGTYWATGDATMSANLELDFGEERWFDVVSIREHLPLGLRVDDWALDRWQDGEWREFARGTGIGARRLWRGAFQRASKLRLRLVDASACPAIAALSVHAQPPRVEITGAPSAFLGQAQVELRATRADAAIHYTLDGVEPGPDAPVYRGPIALDASCTLRAVAEIAGVLSPFVAVREFEAWSEDSLLAAVDAPAARAAGLRYRYYEGGWQTLDQMTDARVVTDGVVEQPGLEVRRRDEHYALRFDGFLRVPEDGIYRLVLTSDDGSRLFLHGALRIDNDGLHGMVERDCRVGLRKGDHPIRIDYFNATGQAGLRLEWNGPGFGQREVPATALRR